MEKMKKEGKRTNFLTSKEQNCFAKGEKWKKAKELIGQHAKNHLLNLCKIYKILSDNFCVGNADERCGSKLKLREWYVEQS